MEDKPSFCASSSAVVNLLDLVRELKEVAWWMRLGLEMGVPKYTMEGIRCQYAMFGEDMCMTEMLSTWLHSRAEKPTWTEVVSAVSRTGSKKLAQRIAENHGLALAGLTEVNTAPRESPAASAAVNLLELIRELEEVVGWMRLGLELGVPMHTLKSIRCEYATHGEDMCKTDMLSTWLNSCAEKPTWAKVVTAVSRLGNRRVANRIAKKHGLSLPPLTEATEFPSDVMASSDPQVSLRREMEVTYKAVEDNDFQLELHTRKAQELEDNQTQIRHNCEIAQKYTKMLEKDKLSLQQKLEDKEKEIMSLHAKQHQYERKIRKLEVKLATADTKTKQKYKERLRILKQEKEDLEKCIEAKQKEVDKLTKDVNKLETKLEGAIRELSFAQDQLDLKSSQIDEVQRELQLVRDQRDKLKDQLGMQEKALEEAAMHSVDRQHILNNTVLFQFNSQQNVYKRRQQEAVIDDRRKVIRSLREYDNDKEKRAKDLRDEAHTIEMEAERLQQNLDSDPHKRRIQEGIIKDKRKEVKSLREQAKRVRPDADGSDVDEDEGETINMDGD